MYRSAYRVIYALSNAGADPNVTDEKGNTPLHEALLFVFDDNGCDLIQVFNFVSNRCGVTFLSIVKSECQSGLLEKN